MAATTTTTTNISSPLPSPAADSGGSDSDTLTIILGFSALLLIPVVIYAFFFALKCPPNPLEWRRRRRSARLDRELTNKSGHAELVYSSVAYKKEGTAIDKGGECPVCLSVLNFEGDEVRQLHVCKHTFHVACIDMWLSSHSNCPVCRASTGSKRSSRPVVEGEDDLRQGLPNSSSLV